MNGVENSPQEMPPPAKASLSVMMQLSMIGEEELPIRTPPPLVKVLNDGQIDNIQRGHQIGGIVSGDIGADGYHEGNPIVSSKHQKNDAVIGNSN